MQPEIHSPEWLALVATIAARTVDAPDGCRVWTGAGGKRGIHGRLKWRGELLAPHRVMLEHDLGRRLRRNEDACHRCDNPPCVNPEHLFAGSRSDNMVDASLKGRLGKPLVAYDTVKAIVCEHRAGSSRPALVERFGLSKGTIDRIVRGKTQLGALAIAEVNGEPYLHPRGAVKPLAKALPLLTRGRQVPA